MLSKACKVCSLPVCQRHCLRSKPAGPLPRHAGRQCQAALPIPWVAPAACLHALAPQTPDTVQSNCAGANTPLEHSACTDDTHICMWGLTAKQCQCMPRAPSRCVQLCDRTLVEGNALKSTLFRLETCLLWPSHTPCTVDLLQSASASSPAETCEQAEVTHVWRGVACNSSAASQVSGRSGREPPVSVRGHHALHGQPRQAPPLAVADSDHLEQVQATGLPASIEALPGPPLAGLSHGWSGTARHPRV